MSQRAIDNVTKLCERFDEYLSFFERRELFTGPSVYFHHRTLELLAKCGSAQEAAHDRRFAELLYATLAAWGLHRMGAGATKLLPFEAFADSLAGAADAVGRLDGQRLLDLADGQVGDVGTQVWQAISSLKLSVSVTKLVVNSKAVHHMLPALVPPIDREYTLRFFYGHKNLSRGEERTFRQMFPLFHRIGRACANSIKGAVGRGFNTSETKVIDNAVVGFVLKEIKS
jgi:hypothetical protein